MRRKQGASAPRRLAPIHAMFGAAILGLAVMPLAFAGASTKAQSSASPKAQIKSLKRRVAALEHKSGPAIPNTLPPNGPAGGVLQGTYPNPSGLSPNSVDATQIVDGGVLSGDLAAHSVGAFELRGTYERVSGGVTAPAGTFVDAATTCNPGDRVLGGGYAFLNPSAFEIEGTTPNVSAGGLDNPDQWIVTASSAIDNQLFAWAVCISA